MKKIIPILALCLLCLTGCGEGYELPEGMDQEAIVAAGLEVVDQLNEGDYEGVWNKFRDDVQQVATVDDVEAMFQQVVVPEGAFVQVTDTMATSDTDDSTKEFYAIAVIIAKHEEDDILYRMSYDVDMTLIGLSISTT